MPSFIYFIVVWWTRSESLRGRFWSRGPMFDTPELGLSASQFVMNLIHWSLVHSLT